MIQHIFANAEPFPFLVIDEFLPAELLYAAAGEFDYVSADAWVRYESADEHAKRTCHRMEAMGQACQQIIACLTNPTAAKIAGWITGIDDLESDPTLYGGGLHVTEPGGFLGIHADNERHPLTGLARRLNLIVYCTPNWRPEWGGELQLFDRACTRPVLAIEPIFNRAVLFETGPRDYHGHPEPVRSPAGISRKSIAVYFWSPAAARAHFVQRADEPFDAQREAARIERSR
jgi:Rps23 Pro-64 3,4-dihydroxylase Tpa1-like proline 4-hydroxylase